jgi:basic membrane lipoprotein Med (substrate-binding protein (PBP1-ABC) superfamily)
MNRFLFALLTAVAIAGCGGNTPSAQTQPKFKVALLTPSSVNDSGWSALAYDGLMGIKDELGAEVNNVVAATPQERRDAMRSYAQQGYNLVIGHGYEYNQDGIEIGPDFPKTVFVSSSGTKTAPNVGTFRFYLEQGMYLLGMTAAKMSKTGVIGMVGGPEVPSIESTFVGFEAGAKSVRSDIKVLKVYTGSNDDVNKAKQQTLALIDQGADFIVHQTNAAAGGVFEACKERHIFALGTNSDQASAAPDTVLASAVIIAKPAFIQLAKEVRAGTYKGEVRLVGMDVGAIGIAWNPALKQRVPKEVLDMVADAETKMKSGALVAPKNEF